MGSAHARVYAKMKYCDLVGICDTNSNKKHVAKMYNCKFFEDSEKFFGENLDAISICTPTSMHREAVLNALDAGKHVLVEKPFTDSLKNGEEMTKKGDENGQVVGCRLY
jgi:UDP-N-acetylglucosamine 3-dehydrogenase